MVSSGFFRVPYSNGTMARKVSFEATEIASILGSMHLDLTIDVRSRDDGGNDWV